MEITDPQQAIAQAQAGALQPPTSCDCTVDTFTSLIEQCLNTAPRYNSKIASKPKSNPGGQDSGSGSSGQPSPYQPFQSATNSKPVDSSSPAPPPSTGPSSSNDLDRDPGSSSDHPAPVHEDVKPQTGPANPSSGSSAPDSQQPSSQSPTDPNAAKDDHVTTPTDSDNVHDNNTTATPAAVNSDPSVPADNAPPSGSDAHSDSHLSVNPSEDELNKGNTNTNGNTPAPASSSGAKQDATPAPAAPSSSSPNGNDFTGYRGFSSDASAPSDPTDNGKKFQKSAHPQKFSSGGCDGVACLTQGEDLPLLGAPNLAGAPLTGLSSAGNGLVGGMGSCPSGDIGLCLDAGTGQ